MISELHVEVSRFGPATNAEFNPLLSTEIFPRDETEHLRDKFRMSKFAEFLERMDALRVEKDFSDRSLSIEVTGKPDLIRTIRKRQALPTGDSLMRLADVLGTTADYLVSGTEIRSDASVRDGPLAFKPQPHRGDLPVLGTAHGGTVSIIDGNSDTKVEQTLFEPTQIIRYITRPRALTDARDAYAIYVEGESMYPRFGPGEMAVVDPRVPPRIGDDVIVQLSENGDDEIHAILIKRLVRRSASFVELEQFNPQAVFRIDAMRVKRLHRICPAGDLLGG